MTCTCGGDYRLLYVVVHVPAVATACCCCTMQATFCVPRGAAEKTAEALPDVGQDQPTEEALVPAGPGAIGLADVPVPIPTTTIFDLQLAVWRVVKKDAAFENHAAVIEQ